MNSGKSNYTILYFLDYAKRFGGAANAILQQAILMKNVGHKVVLFFSDYLGNQVADEFQAICKHSSIEWKWTTFQLSSQPEDIDIVCADRNYEKIKRDILVYKPDILHSMQINLSVELVSRELRIPHIMNIYPLIPDFFSVKYLSIFPHYHLCDSWYYARKWEYYLKTDSFCIRTVVNNKNNIKSRDKDFIKCICVGTLYKEKNQLVVIKAFHKALKDGINGKLVLCGYTDSSYARECMQYIEENSLKDSIVVKGFCMEMGAEYADSDVLICGSTRESYPNAISEAMANGLIVISTPVAGVPEVIIDGVNGYLAKDYSTNALYAKILEYQGDLQTGKIKSILKNAEKSFQMYHSPKAVTSQLLHYYQYVWNDCQKKGKNEFIGINEIRKIFEGLLHRFVLKENFFTDSNQIALKLWYLYHVEKNIISAFSENVQFYIWGTGKYGVIVKELIDIFVPEILINGFMDSKKEGTFLGYDIYHPDEILQEQNNVILIAAVNGQNEMIEKLKMKKRIFNKDYFILSPRRW